MLPRARLAILVCVFVGAGASAQPNAAHISTPAELYGELFTRVLPRGWARVRAALADAESEGRTLGEGKGFDPTLWEHIMEVARG